MTQIKTLLFSVLIAFSFQACTNDDTIRVLCIGNSFSWDAVEQELAPLCESEGQSIIIGNLYYGGCSLEQHHTFLMKDTGAYSFRYIEQGIRTLNEGYSLRQALKRMKWDYISFQQASHDSGIQGSYEPYLQELIDTVRAYQPDAKLCWMQTWSYSQDAKHPQFPRYQKNQQIMDDSIHCATIALLKRHPGLTLIPCGKAITLARQTKLGDTLCRDGYHLNYEYGRYTAACVWYELLTGKNCKRNLYMNPEMTEEQRQLTQQAAHKAMRWATFKHNLRAMFVKI
jgi:beta-glucosidase